MNGPYLIDGVDGGFETLAEAAQEAEHLHAESGEARTVRDERGEVAYVSLGAPE